MSGFDKKFENKLTLTAVILFAAIITSVIIYQNATHSFLGQSYRDVFFYLIESLRMSGVEITGYAYVNYLSPFIPFLTSILFRLGFVSQASIFITSGVFFFIGIVGMFFLLRLRFNNFYSFFGSFLYGTLSINIKWVANGTLDIAFVTLMIWALYFFIQAMEKNQKYFYLAFPLIVLTFFTKYPGALIVEVIALYFVCKTNFISNIRKYYKNIFGGIIAGLITAVPFFAYFFLNNIPFGFLNQASGVSSESSLTVTHAGKLVGNDLFFYINGIKYNISGTDYIVGIILLAVTIIGIALMLYVFFDTLKNSFSKIKHDSYSIYKFNVGAKMMYGILIIALALILFSFFTASLFSFIYSEVLLFIGLYLLAYSITKIIMRFDDVDDVSSSRFPYLAINITMLGLFLVYLVFFSAHLVKADRYFTSMVPGFIFIVVLSFEMLFNRFNGINIKFTRAVPIIIMLMMLIVSAQYIAGISDDSLALNEESVADWLKGNDGIIYSDRGPIYTWNLQKEVPYVRNLTNNTLLNQELLDNNATYYVSSVEVNLTDYEPVKEFGSITVYASK